MGTDKETARNEATRVVEDAPVLPASLEGDLAAFNDLAVPPRFPPRQAAKDSTPQAPSKQPEVRRTPVPRAAATPKPALLDLTFLKLLLVAALSIALFLLAPAIV